MFGPESTATGRSRTSVESRSPVAGSRPFVSESAAPPGGSAADDLREGAARERRGRRASAPAGTSLRGGDVAEVDVRQVARVAAGLGDRRGLLGVAADERDLVVAVGQQAGERGAPGAAPDDDSAHTYDRLTKSIETGTPSSSKRSRSWFSTQ